MGDENGCHFYWNPEYVERADVVLDHSFRACYFTWGFNDEENEYYKSFIEAPTPGHVLRVQICRLCIQYIERKLRELDLESLEKILSDINEFGGDRGIDRPGLFILAKAALAEAMYCVKAFSITGIFAQGGILNKHTTVQPGMCHLTDSLDASMEMFDWVHESRIPTSRVKNDAGDVRDRRSRSR
ncbi:hypothetical protein SCP_1400320 [Sparassis crispa]|uniref:Uncharacterized protein n=1 Tax=Sparassis crispa TaxID=139825 RepID=A0A401H2G9_9APHY|nr:hypothetical protein SCP_1400320 [Sparassis crispa]GBE88627.1 hypothetical protein SCP_1400320 [Sparassis crispa]